MHSCTLVTSEFLGAQVGDLFTMAGHLMLVRFSINPLVPRMQQIKIPKLALTITFTGLICKGNSRF